MAKARSDIRKISLSSPAQMAGFAQELKKFIVSNKLYTPIQGKNYVNVEGWQYAGAVTGILPIVKRLENQSSDSETKYWATVELQRIADGTIAGTGFAVCSDKETNFKGKPEYVIASMAQTRAIGKGYRNLFAWLMKMAGYEPTPAEDMIQNGGSFRTAGFTDDADPEVYDKITNVKSKAELQAIISRMSAGDLANYTNAITEKKKELKR